MQTLNGAQRAAVEFGIGQNPAAPETSGAGLDARIDVGAKLRALW